MTRSPARSVSTATSPHWRADQRSAQETHERHRVPNYRLAYGVRKIGQELVRTTHVIYEIAVGIGSIVGPSEHRVIAIGVGEGGAYGYGRASERDRERTKTQTR